MKTKVFTIVLGIIVVITLGLCVTYLTQTNTHNTYSHNGIVIDNETLRDENGNIWKYDTTYDKGTEVKIVFNNKDTKTIFDDEVMKVTHS